MQYIIADIRIDIPREFAAGSFGMALAPFAAKDEGPADLTVAIRGQVREAEGYRILDEFDFADADADCRFGRDAEGYLLTMTPRDGAPAARFRKSFVAPLVTTDVTLRHNPALFRFGLWSMFNIAAVARQAVAIHSSVICLNGQAVLFLGESGTGKSTHTRLWREHIPGATLLNDDSPIIRIMTESADITTPQGPAVGTAATPIADQATGTTMNLKAGPATATTTNSTENQPTEAATRTANQSTGTAINPADGPTGGAATDMPHSLVEETACTSAITAAETPADTAATSSSANSATPSQSDTATPYSANSAPTSQSDTAATSSANLATSSQSDTAVTSSANSATSSQSDTAATSSANSAATSPADTAATSSSANSATPSSANSATTSPAAPSPARPSVLAFGAPWSGKTPCYRNISCPIRAIVRLSQAPHNRIRRLRAIEAIGALLPSCPPSFAYDERLEDAVCATISAAVAQVPIYHLECLPDAAAAELACRTIFGDESANSRP